MLARVRDMNRLECVGETLRFTLNRLATRLPDWLARQLQPEWAARYGPRAEEYRLPLRSTSGRTAGGCWSK